jgi:steroid 5-alpha reductase family enzyme
MTYYEHMADVTVLAAWGWALSAALMAALWAWHLRIRNAGVVDVGWSLSLPLMASLYAWLGPGHLPRRLLIAGMFIVWGSRLAVYLLRDRVLGRPEDSRYADLRQRHSPAAALAFFPFFQAQALVAVLLSVPALVAAFNPEPRLSYVEFAAVALWCLALAGESIADRQLERFKARPDARGRTCREGLWRYSRHPNYFFEWLIWVAYALFALASPWGWLALSAPALMLYLLFRVTGIPATEAQALRSRGDDYRQYQATTSAFVPWFPRSTT